MEKSGSPSISIEDVISSKTVDLELKGIEAREDLLEHLVNLLYEAGKISSIEEFLSAVEAREAQAPTYMENHIAIPHGKSSSVISAAVAFGRSEEGILYETPQGGGIAKLIFLLAVPDRVGPDQYVRTLAHLARLLVHEEFLRALYSAENYEDVVQAIREGESLLSSRSH